MKNNYVHFVIFFTDLEARFSFPDPNTFPQPEPFTACNKVYPSKSQARRNTQHPGSKLDYL